MTSRQFDPIARLAAFVLGVVFLVAAAVAFVAGLFVSGLPLWFALLSVPFAGFGSLLFSAGRLGEDPEWFYNALDVPEHEVGEDPNG